jgi:hypothetical protein
MRRVSFLLSAFALTAACSAPPSEQEAPLGTSSARVINGVVDVPAKYDSTILIQTEISGG